MGTGGVPLYHDVIPDKRYCFADFVGGGFLLGGACGSTFHFTRGLCRRGSPSPPAIVGGRLAGAAHAVRANAPRVAGRLGAYSALLGALDMTMAHMRRKDDLWNTITAGGSALGLFNVRRGGRAAAVSTLFGATIVAAILGADWVLDEWDTRFASEPVTTRMNNAGPLPPATTPRPDLLSAAYLGDSDPSHTPRSVGCTRP
ncbi:unnamed protein product [Urochloa decumbens]|uniref:Uncharacterized protein n=1 Tax=Urochloa decumbens TaxID=240449 RepID=A0ABC9C0Q2_9POAL